MRLRIKIKMLVTLLCVASAVAPVYGQSRLSGKAARSGEKRLTAESGWIALARHDASGLILEWYFVAESSGELSGRKPAAGDRLMLLRACSSVPGGTATEPPPDEGFNPDVVREPFVGKSEEVVVEVLPNIKEEPAGMTHYQWARVRKSPPAAKVRK
jgi:hypothetical protein